MWNRSKVFAGYRDDEQFKLITGGKYDRFLSRDLDIVASLTLAWVIENQLPVVESLDLGYDVYFYEDLLHSDAEIWSRVCQSLDLDVVPAPELLAKPSQQTSLSASGLPKTRRWDEPRWRKTLSAEQLRTIQNVLDETECNLYSVSSVIPTDTLVRKV